MSKTVFGFVVLASITIVLIICSCQSKTEKEIVVEGYLVNQDNSPIYGATAKIGNSHCKTDINGFFSLKTHKSSNYVSLSGNGYITKKQPLYLNEEIVKLGKLKLISHNKEKLHKLNTLIKNHDYSQIFLSFGLETQEDTTRTIYLANAHMNLLNSLSKFNKTVRISDFVHELYLFGIRKCSGEPISTHEFIGILDGLFNSAYVLQNEPRLLFVLFLMMNEEGSIEIPNLSESYEFSIGKASLLYYVTYLTALQECKAPDLGTFQNYKPIPKFQFASLQICDNSKFVNYNLMNFGREFINKLSFTPIISRTLRPTGILSKLIFNSTGGIVGYYLGWVVAGGLTINSNEVTIPSIPFIVNGFTVSRSITGGAFGSFLSRSWANDIGRSLEYSLNSDRFIDENGDIIIPSDIRITLTWEGGPLTDVDLHLIDPNYERVFYRHKLSAIGAELDVDDRDGYGPENITLERGKAIEGRYQIIVNYYDDQGAEGNPVFATINLTINEGRSDQIKRTYGPQIIHIASEQNPHAYWEVISFNFSRQNITYFGSN